MASDRIFPRWMVVLAAICLVGMVLYALRGVLAPVFFAFLIAYMLDPVVDRFEERGLPRSVGIGVMLTAVLGALVAFIVLAVPGLVRDAGSFINDLPELVARARAYVEPLLADYGVELPHSVSDAMDQWHIDSQQLRSAAAPAGSAVKWLLGGTLSALGTVLGAIMVPVFAAYLLHDFDRITAGTAKLVPAGWRPFVVDVAREVDEVLGAFIRGQLIVMVVLAVLYTVAYAALGVRLAVLIGVVAGFLSFIPYVGGAVALGLALLMCLIDWGGWWQVGGVVIVYSVIQVIEGFVITPRVVGEKVGLPAIWVLFALTAGGELFGFTGVLLALPAAAVIKIFVVRALSTYRQSAFYRSSEPTAGALFSLLTAEGLPDDAETKANKRAATRPPSEPSQASDNTSDSAGEESGPEAEARDNASSDSLEAATPPPSAEPPSPKASPERADEGSSEAPTSSPEPPEVSEPKAPEPPSVTDAAPADPEPPVDTPEPDASTPPLVEDVDAMFEPPVPRPIAADEGDPDPER